MQFYRTIAANGCSGVTYERCVRAPGKRSKNRAAMGLLLREAKVAVRPGIGFGPSGEGHVRFALVENQHRITQAVKGIRRALAKL